MGVVINGRYIYICKDRKWLVGVSTGVMEDACQLS